MSQDDIERDISNPKKKKDRNFLNYGTARKIDRCNVFLSGEEGRFKRFFFFKISCTCIPVYSFCKMVCTHSILFIYYCTMHKNIYFAGHWRNNLSWHMTNMHALLSFRVSICCNSNTNWGKLILCNFILIFFLFLRLD